VKIEELNQLYQEADSAGQELFAEQRSNLLLVAGQHYHKKGSRFWNRIRESEALSKEQKLRLTKNHTQRIAKIYKANILTHAPGVTIGPKNPSELSDVKTAQLHGSVWDDIKYRHKMKKKVREYVSDFVDIGEMICKVGFDEQAGRLLGFEADVDPATGEPVLDEKGEPAGLPKFSGDHTFERIFGFNFLCDPAANSFDEARHVIVRKMLPVKDLKKRFKGDETKLKLIVESQDETFKIFDTQSGQYKEGKGMCMVREFYFRKCADYPNGWYSITTSAGVLFEGELPLGVFPIIYAGFDEVQTSPRSYSIIKQLRPYQAEINRAASKIAEHQVTLGDDKLVLIGGSKIAHGGTAHGVKAINVTGAAPVHLPGRTGEQYVGYMQSQIDEMYKVASVQEETEEKGQNGQLDPYALLFRSMKDKKRFSQYGEKVEQFLIELCEVALRYAKAYYTEDMLVPATGKKELVNIPEFKKADDLGMQIKLEAMAEDIESKMGKQLVLNHALQFVGPQLDRSDIGMIMKSMPYGNSEQIFEELTMDYENAVNDILALDRGEQVGVSPQDNHVYIIKKLTSRMKKRDFQSLPPPVQQLYQMKVQAHQQAEAQRQQEIAAANSGYIPSGGFLVACDFYVDGGDGKAPKRARVPYESIDWLIKKLQQQGQDQQQLASLDPESQAAIGRQLQPQQGQPQGQPQPNQPQMAQGILQ
jgi:hypothetical protein